MGRKDVGPVCCVMHVKEPRTLIVKEKGLAPVFLEWQQNAPKLFVPRNRFSRDRWHIMALYIIIIHLFSISAKSLLNTVKLVLFQGNFCSCIIIRRVVPVSVDTCRTLPPGVGLFLVQSDTCPAGNEVSYGSMCSYDCTEGYVIQGGSSLTCGEDGQWLQTLPRCEGQHC